MKHKRNLSYRGKLYLSNILVVLVVVVGITLIMTLTASRQAETSNRLSLDLLTDQALQNFISGTKSTSLSLYSSCASTAVPEKMNEMRKMDIGTPQFVLAANELTNILGYTVTGSSPFDAIAVCLDLNGACISGSGNKEILQEVSTLFNIDGLQDNTYGRVQWIRLQSGSLWLVRDVYLTSPLRHVGKSAARVKTASLVSLNQENKDLEYNVLFFNKDGQFMTSAEESAEEIIAAASALLEASSDLLQASGIHYAVSIKQMNGWTAIGIQPMRVVQSVQLFVWQTALIVALGGLIFGLGLSLFMSRRLSNQIRSLTDSMNLVAHGNLDVSAKVESTDEIGQLAEHFNSMTLKTKQLMEKLVQEAASKRRAEYQNLEYKYRFLQWQINPHFIYNALETVNGLAKLDGNDELCEMIIQLSDYFRQNAETMRKRFLPVQQEFHSLEQYAGIYSEIYASTTEVQFTIDGKAGDAYLPTMIVQPLLENALVHGTNFTGMTLIKVIAVVQGETLSIRIEDNGPGMDEATISRMLEKTDVLPQTKAEKTSLGVRNVKERLQLIYGDTASLSVESKVEEGTTVTLSVPLSYQEWNQPFHIE